MSSKITALTALTSVQTDDVLPVVDVHDTTMASSGTTKQITVANLQAALLKAASNLSDLANAGTARGNLGLGTAATAALTSLLQAANNLSDLASAATARTNLGLTGAATASLPLSLANGGTGQATAQAALDALAAATTSGQVLRGNGTHVQLAAIQGADVPTLNQNTTGTAAGLSSTLAVGSGGTGQVTQQAAIDALSGTQSAGKVLRSDGTHATLAAIQAGDVPTLNQNTSGSAASLSATLAIGSGGTGQITQQAALDALAGAQTANQVLKGNGTHVTLAALAAADLPAGTTSAQGALQLDGTAGDIAALGAQAAGAIGKPADAGHVHPTTGLALLTGAVFTGAVSVNSTALSSPQPADLNLLAWAWDPASNPGGGAVLGSGGATAAAGILNLIKIPLYGQTVSSTGLRLYLVTAGSGLTSSQNFAYLYNSSGTFIGATADQTTNWTGSAGAVDANWTSGPFNVSGQFCWAAVVYNGTTGPSLLRGSNLTAAMANGKLSNANSRNGSILSGITSAAPGNFTPSSITQKAATLWAALF